MNILKAASRVSRSPSWRLSIEPAKELYAAEDQKATTEPIDPEPPRATKACRIEVLLARKELARLDAKCGVSEWRLHLRRALGQ